MLVIVSIRFEFRLGIFRNPPGFLTGDYEEFSPLWFVDFGSLIIQTLVIEIFILHCVPLAQKIFLSCRRCCDRSCTCDKRRSKMLIQSDYEKLYTGPEFLIDVRLAQIIVFTWVTFMFSVGMPVLFLVSAVNFFVMYWIDKWLVLRFYKTPRNLNEDTIKYTLANMKQAVIFHVIIGFMMLSNKRILSSSPDFDD